ncbi:MAG: hypothetical protein IT440_01050 [Phycisphaeraceae bacterium]|nr:hypothetical protein [Phycisphaeraceae bacterium]
MTSRRLTSTLPSNLKAVAFEFSTSPFLVEAGWEFGDRSRFAHDLTCRFTTVVGIHPAASPNGEVVFVSGSR